MKGFICPEKNSTEQKKKSEPNGISDPKGTISKTERKLIVKRWRDITPKGISGVYQIKNKINGRYYIGSAKDFIVRFNDHLKRLSLNTHHNKKLQHDWNKYGHENYEFFVLEACAPENRFILEQKYLDIGFRDEPNLCLNLSPVALVGSIREYPIEVRRKMSASQKRNENKYEFHNIITKESLFCSMFELRDKYPELDVHTLSQVIRNECDSHKGWTLNHKLEKVLNLTTAQGKNMQTRIKTAEERNNPIFYHFINIKTKEEFIGSKFDLIKKYYYGGFSVHIDLVIKKKQIHASFWVLKERLEEILAGKTFASKYLLTILNKQVNPPSYELLSVSTSETFNGTELEFRKLNNFKDNKGMQRLLNNTTFNYRFWIKKENYEKFLTSDHNACKMLRNKVSKLNNSSSNPSLSSLP